MSRRILIEDEIKKELGITNSGCISSFSSIVSKHLTQQRETKHKEVEKTRKILEVEALIYEYQGLRNERDKYKHQVQNLETQVQHLREQLVLQVNPYLINSIIKDEDTVNETTSEV